MTLTAREVDVLILILEGKTSQETADALFISKRTVDFHLANVYEKLKVKNRIGLLREAIRSRLIQKPASFWSLPNSVNSLEATTTEELKLGGRTAPDSAV